MTYYVVLFLYEFSILLLMKRRVTTTKNDKRWLVFFMALPIFLLVALRGQTVGSDTSNYTRMYIIEASGYSDNDVSRLEPGYRLFVRLLSSLGLPPQGLFIVSGLVCLMSLSWFIYRYADNVGLSILLYLGLGLFGFQLSGVRQSLAMSICLFSFPYIERKALIKFLLLVTLAITFHTSAVVFLPAYFAARLPLSYKWVLAEVVVVGVAVFFGTEIIEMASSVFTIQYGIENDSGGAIFAAIMVFIALASFILKNKLVELNYTNKIFINLSFLASIMWIFRIISRTLERPSMFYLFSTCILLGNMTKIKYKGRGWQSIMLLCLMVISMGFFYRRVCINPTIVPYRLFWQ